MFRGRDGGGGAAKLAYFLRVTYRGVKSSDGAKLFCKEVLFVKLAHLQSEVSSRGGRDCASKYDSVWGGV